MYCRCSLLCQYCLQYTSVMWNTRYCIHSQRIMSIHRAFSRHRPFQANNFSHRQVYKDRLARFHKISFRISREVSDVTFLHNILNNNVTNSESFFFFVIQLLNFINVYINCINGYLMYGNLLLIFIFNYDNKVSLFFKLFKY